MSDPKEKKIRSVEQEMKRFYIITLSCLGCLIIGCFIFRNLDPRELMMTPFSFSNSLIAYSHVGSGIFHFRVI